MIFIRQRDVKHLFAGGNTQHTVYMIIPSWLRNAPFLFACTDLDFLLYGSSEGTALFMKISGTICISVMASSTISIEI